MNTYSAALNVFLGKVEHHTSAGCSFWDNLRTLGWNSSVENKEFKFKRCHWKAVWTFSGYTTSPINFLICKMEKRITCLTTLWGINGMRCIKLQCFAYYKMPTNIPLPFLQRKSALDQLGCCNLYCLHSIHSTLNSLGKCKELITQSFRKKTKKYWLKFRLN